MNNPILIDQLKRLEQKHWPESQRATRAKSRLRVFYGWAKLGKVRKREAISVIYENTEGVAEHHRMGKLLPKAQYTVCWRYQTEGEAKDAKSINRVFSEYSVFMDDPRIKGSLEKALKANSEADRKNVSQQERKRIADELRKWYMSEHRGYKEPTMELELEFKEPEQ